MPKSTVLLERDINVTDGHKDTLDAKTTVKFRDFKSIGIENSNTLIRNDIINRSSIRDTLKKLNDRSLRTGGRRSPALNVIELKKSESAIEVKSIVNNDLLLPNKVLRKRKRYTEAAFTPQVHKLADDSYRFQLPFESKKFIKYAAPLHHLNEFNPFNKTDEGILLSILKFEFQKIDDEEEHKFDLSQEMGYVKPRNLINYICGLLMDYRWLLDPFIRVDRNEYLRRYPWDQFYDPELYFENGINEKESSTSNEHGLNLDMMPDELKEEIILNHKSAQAEFRFRRQFNSTGTSSE